MDNLLRLSLLTVVLLAAAVATPPASDENVRGRSISGSRSGGHSEKRPDSSEEDDGRGRSASSYGSGSSSGSRRANRPLSSEEDDRSGRSGRRDESSEENQRGRSSKLDRSSEESSEESNPRRSNAGSTGRSSKRTKSSEEVSDKHGRSSKRTKSSEEVSDKHGRSSKRTKSSEEVSDKHGRSSKRTKSSEEVSDKHGRSSKRTKSSEEVSDKHGRSAGRPAKHGGDSSEENSRGRSAAAPPSSIAKIAAPNKEVVKAALKQDKVMSKLVDKIKTAIDTHDSKQKTDVIQDVKKAIKESKKEMHEIKKDLHKQAQTQSQLQTPRTDPPAALDKNSNCLKTNPKPIDPSAEFSKIFHTHRVYVPLANREYFDLYSEILTGKIFREQKPSEACLRLIWDPRHRRAIGFGEKAIMQCESVGFAEVNKCHRPDKKGISSHGGDFKMTSIMTDGVTAFLRVGCTAKGRAVWGILSNNETISQTLEKKFLNELTRLGLAINDQVRLDYENCEEELKEDVNEGTCPENPVPSHNVDKDAVLRILEGGVYTLLSSELNVYANALFVRQSPLEETEDYDSVCPFQKFEAGTEPDHKVHVSGFKNLTEVLDCDTDDLSHITCRPDQEEQDDHDPATYTADVNVVWSDNKNNVLVFNCLSDNLQSWALYSTSSTPISEELRGFVLDKVAANGFDREKSWTASYSRCSHLNPSSSSPHGRSIKPPPFVKF